MSTQSDLAELYTAFFNRAPDADGLAYWVSELNAGKMSLETIATNWADDQPESQQKYPNTLSTEEFINAVYTNVLGRASDSEGAAYWRTGLESSGLSRDVFIMALLNGAKANTSTQGQADAALVNNKALVGVAFAEKGLNDTTLASKVLTSVSSNADTLDATLSVIKLIPTNVGGQSPAVLNLVSSTLDKIAALIKGAPAELTDLATYLAAVATNVGTGTNLISLLTTVNTKVETALTNPSALDNPTAQAGTDVTTATPGSAPGTPPVFTVTQTSEGVYTVGSQNGAVSVSVDEVDYVFTPTTGDAVTVKTSLVQSLVVNVRFSPDLQAFESGFAGIGLSGTGTLVIPEGGIFSTSASFLTLLLGSVGVRVDVGNIPAVTGSVEDIVALYSLPGTEVTGLGSVDLAATDNTVTLADLAKLDAFTNGTLTYNTVIGTSTALTGSKYVAGEVSVQIQGGVTLEQLNTLGLKTAGSLSFDSISGTTLQLANSTFVKGTGVVSISDLDEAGNISSQLNVKQLLQLKSLQVEEHWQGSLQDTAANLLVLTQGQTRNVEVTITNDDAGVVSVQQRSDLAKFLTYENESDWKYGLSDTAHNLLASFKNDSTVIDGADSVSVTNVAALSIADIENLQEIAGSDVAFSVTDTLANLTAASPVLLSNGYTVADSLEALTAAIAEPSELFAARTGYVVVDTLANLKQAKTDESTVLAEARDSIVADTLENLTEAFVSSQLNSEFRVTDFVSGTQLNFPEALVFSLASNNNDFINDYSIKGSVEEYEGAPGYFFKYASSVSLTATASGDHLNGNLTDGKITVEYTAGTQASHFEAASGSFIAQGGSFDTYSMFYGTPSNPDRDHIDLTSFSLTNEKSDFLATGTLADGQYAFVKGNYGAGGVFKSSASGTDTLVAWDADNTDGVDQVAIVLVGQSPNNANPILILQNELP